MKRLLDPLREEKNAVTLAKETASVMLDLANSSKCNSVTELSKILHRAEKMIVEENYLEFTIENVVRKIINLIIDVDTDESSGQLKSKKFSNLKRLFERDDSVNQAEDVAATAEVVEDKEAFKAKRAKIVDAITNLITELESINDSINAYAANHINSGDVVLTYGYSDTIRQFLIEAKQERSFEVIVLEGEQQKSGQKMVQELTKGGVSASLIPFSSAFAFMSRVNKIFVGAHAITKNGGVLSRTGVLMLAVAAKLYSVPVIILAPAIKLTNHFPFEQNSLNEILPPQLFCPSNLSGSDKATVIVTRFDYVSPEYISLYVTDHGEHTPAYIYRLFNEFYSKEE